MGQSLLIDPLGLLLVLALALIARALRALDWGGVLAGFAIGYAAWLGGRLPWLLILALVLALSTQATRLRYPIKARLGVAQEKGGVRGWRNVASNAGVAGFAGLLENFYTSDPLPLVFTGSLAAALADTLATEVGLLSPSQPRLFIDLRKKVFAGSSGGVTVLGILAAVAGSAITVGAASILRVLPSPTYYVVAACTLAGFLGSILDSALGATVQAQYQCSKCAGIVEAPIHCSQKASLVHGLSWIRNDAVNGFATAAAGLSAPLLSWLLFF